MFDLVGLLVGLGGTVVCGAVALRRQALPRAVAWPLLALTPVMGFLTF